MRWGHSYLNFYDNIKSRHNCDLSVWWLFFLLPTFFESQCKHDKLRCFTWSSLRQQSCQSYTSLCVAPSFERREVLPGLWWGGGGGRVGGHEEERVFVARQRGRGLSQHRACFWRSFGGSDSNAHSQRPWGSCSGETYCGLHRGARWVMDTKARVSAIVRSCLNIWSKVWRNNLREIISKNHRCLRTVPQCSITLEKDLAADKMVTDIIVQKQKLRLNLSQTLSQKCSEL